MSRNCAKCGSATEPGYVDARGLLGFTYTPQKPRALFVVHGSPTAANPITAFKQGLADEPVERAYLLEGHRCPSCGSVELFAAEPTPNSR